MKSWRREQPASFMSKGQNPRQGETQKASWGWSRVSGESGWDGWAKSSETDCEARYSQTLTIVLKTLAFTLREMESLWRERTGLPGSRGQPNWVQAYRANTKEERLPGIWVREEGGLYQAGNHWDGKHKLERSCTSPAGCGLWGKDKVLFAVKSNGKEGAAGNWDWGVCHQNGLDGKWWNLTLEMVSLRLLRRDTKYPTNLKYREVVQGGRKIELLVGQWYLKQWRGMTSPREQM